MFRLLVTLCFVALAPLLAAPSYDVLAEFERPGQAPTGRLLYVAATGSYYGTTTTGGKYDKGTVYRLTPGGVKTTLVSFSGIDGPAKGELPVSGLTLGPDGALYGVTLRGGSTTYDSGTVFRLTTSGAFSTVVEFTGAADPYRGTGPNELLLAEDGNFYGTTQGGGSGDLGTFYRLTPAGGFTSFFQFSGTAGAHAGSAPVGALVQGGLAFYGVTQAGGGSDQGTIFKIAMKAGGNVEAFSTLTAFTGTSGAAPGAYPSDGLVLQGDSLYGVTEQGGSADSGVVFKCSISNKLTFPLFQFNDDNGSYPDGALSLLGDSLYGTTSAGGDFGVGTIFSLHPVTGAYTLLATLTNSAGPAPGGAPMGGLIQGPNGELVGATSSGGNADDGTIFKIDPDKTVTFFATFDQAGGWSPAGVPAWSGAKLLLPVEEGGAKGHGALAEVPGGGGAPVLVQDFGMPLGESPAGPLAFLDGDYFGFTAGGGAAGRGTFFRYRPGSGVTTLAQLTASLGASPEGPPVLGPDGAFYAVANEGGSAGKGAILRLTTDGNLRTLASFTGAAGSAPGAQPHGPLVLGKDGYFYGVTEYGGTNNRGTLFKMTPYGAVIPLVQFGASGPAYPVGGLVMDLDGDFYGTTAEGGAYTYGTLFKYSGNTLTVLKEFSGLAGSAPGAYPLGRLAVAVDGTLYGTTSTGGSSNSGTIFRRRPDGAYTTLFNLTGVTGGTPGNQPVGGLVFGPDCRLYGITAAGGSGGGGTMFRLSGLGMHVRTDPPSFATLFTTLRGRLQTENPITLLGFDSKSVLNLVLPIVGVPVATTGADGITQFSLAQVSLLTGNTLTYRASATTILDAASGDFLTFTVPPPLAGWKLSLLGSTTADDLGDLDLDGVANLLEYALGTDPAKPDAGPPAPTLKHYPEGDRLSLRVPRDPARNDVTIRVLGAGSLAGPWTTLATSANGQPFTGPGYVGGDSNSAGVKSVEIRDTVNMEGNTRRFMKISASE